MAKTYETETIKARLQPEMRSRAQVQLRGCNVGAEAAAWAGMLRGPVPGSVLALVVPFHRATWHSMAWHSTAWHGVALHSTARHGMA